MRKDPLDCPSSSCNGGAQIDVEADELKGKVGADESWIDRAKMCAHCGIYYSDDPDGHRRIRGHFSGNTLRSAENWRSVRS